MKKRENVWVGVAGLVMSPDGQWLVVKKKYGGLKGYWSLPAGFVDPGETADQAAVREVFEETGVQSIVKGMIGLRTGVIKGEISDNMILFQLEPLEKQIITVQENELFEAKFMHPNTLVKEKKASVMLQYLLQLTDSPVKPEINGINPGDQFQYTIYKLFL
ncbi:NUDIX domain-containing protein [Bacillus sp. T33-2]|uniref:NUDIX domain-containing protein n=1 Tax=Bacillus sp. T33-2 TaxID=2054168 RepID=UPI000C761F71|nr:NUDIX hydrolase [Bacillus sp. T33-2]PLR92634.1 NUDIX hydrolase [Bacillus sp. T33-2]